MFKSLLILTLFCAYLLTSLSAEFVPLKGSNGKVIEFLVQSVEPDGVIAQHRGAYKFSLIQWEQLDLDWLKQNQINIWKQKQHHEAMKKVAYGEFKFGQSLREVSQMIKAHNGVQLPNEPFKDAKKNAMWITFKPKEMRQFLRFNFDENNKLIEIQLHTNFDQEQAIETEMLTEWERLVQLVNGYGTDIIENRSYPKPSEWRRWKSNASAEKQSAWRTHRWKDALREFELGLESKQIQIATGKREVKSITKFGYELSDNTSTARSNTNWVVYKSKLKDLGAND